MMENSFFEYRENGADSGSDSEVIDNSMVSNVPLLYSAKKTNRTAYVAESEESSNDEEDHSISVDGITAKAIARRSSAGAAHVISSSEDDGKRKGASKLENKVVLSSSGEETEEYSPELVPKRPPLGLLNSNKKPLDSNDSIVIRKTKKRMLFADSDTDNSFIIEQNKNRKHPCLKDTPLKIESKHIAVNETMQDDDDDESCDGDESGDEEMVSSDDETESDNNDSNNYSSSSSHKKKIIRNAVRKTPKKFVITSDDDDEIDDDGENHKIKQQSSVRKTPKKLIITSDSEDENEPNKDIDKPSSSFKVEDKSSTSLKNVDKSNDSHNRDDDHNKNSVMTDNENDVNDDDEGPDEDMMVMSRATRMSIMGVIPKDNDSDASDFIQSDSSSRKTADNIAASFEDLTTSFDDLEARLSEQKSDNANVVESDNDLPKVTIKGQTPRKNVKNDISNVETKPTSHEDHDVSANSNDSRITCSPFSSPLNDITNNIDIKKDTKRKSKALNHPVNHFMDLTTVPGQKPRDLSQIGMIDLCDVDSKVAQNKANESMSVLSRKKAVDDDDVAVIETNTSVIALSSDDDDEEPTKPQRRSKASNNNNIPNMESIKRYVVPPSYPNQVVYVSQKVMDEQTDALQRLLEDQKNVKLLLETMQVKTLPDGGSKLRTRHAELTELVRRRRDKLSRMLVAPEDEKSAAEQGLSWDDLQKASNEVQPRMFGKQAMATHMAERNLILESLRDLHAALGSRPADSELAPQPRLLRSTLMPYQRHALAWLQWRETQKPASGLLADDMGLGKTITMISLMASDKEGKIDHEDDPDEGSANERLARGGTLVVCPASLIQQWASEVGKHCSAHALSVCLHHGAGRSTHAHTLARHDMVATTYNILQRDNDKNGVLMRIQWRRIILDEAHIVRNHKSATSVAVSNLKGKRRWCLTGTPVQNKDLDLFALLKFLRVSPFDDLQMWKKWIDNKSQGGQERLSTIMRCILLRRTKLQLQQRGQLQCLPERSPHLTQVTLTKDEMNVYQKVLVLSKTLFAQFLHQRAEKNSTVTSFAAPGKDSEYTKMHKRMIALQGVKPVKSHEILVLLLRLRQVCCHCGLIGSMLGEGEPHAEPEAAGADLLRELDKLSLEDSNKRKSQLPPEEAEEESAETAKADEAIRAVLAPNHPVFQLHSPSSKIRAVMDTLQERVFANKGDKAVVVSQWTSVLRLVEHELSKRKVKSVTLSGAVPVPARPRLIDQLNDPKSDVKVMLLSLCAGGVGINLCGANHLLLLDPHWNPQLEEQAQDRIYRLGQSKHVHIYRFMCVDTVEQTIRKLQEAKLQLAESVLTGARNTAASSLSIEDLKFLFNMGS